MKENYSISGMNCAACSAAVERSVAKLEGVHSANVSLLLNSMTVDYDESELDAPSIVKAVEHAGYQAAVAAAENKHGRDGETRIGSDIAEGPEKESRDYKNRLILSIVFLIPLLYFAMGGTLGLPFPTFLRGMENAANLGFLEFLLVLPIIQANRKYYSNGFKALAHRAPNMDSLIAVGSSAAVLYGVFALFRIGYGFGHSDMQLVDHYSMDLYFESAGTILTLITVGKYLETRAKGRTTEAISKLLDLAPKTAVVLRSGEEEEIPASDIIAGDIVVIRPGETIPVDGVLIWGSGLVDQSALTGESIPVEKMPGDSVMSASINKTGAFRFEAKRVGNDTTLGQIIRLVEEAASSKAPISRLADKISRVFVPVVIGIAALAVIVWLAVGSTPEFALTIGIAVLVISCPCALGLATPLAIMVGTGKGASNGILIKSAEALETVKSIDTVVLDKTGTITTGKPVVTDTIPADDISAEKLLVLAASMEKMSEHPLAEAIVGKAKESELVLYQAENFRTVTGRGITAEIKGERYYIGNRKMMEEINADVADSTFGTAYDGLARQGKTPLFIGKEGKLYGMIAAADPAKPDSAEAIRHLTQMGINVIMLTGDNKATAEAIRSELGIPDMIAEVLPAEKEQEVRRLQEQGRHVAMVGDGINDAPGLARADIGIAVGAGTDIAIESADIVLMKSSLMDVVTAIELSRATIRNIKQNLFWAFFYNCLGIPLAAGVFYSIAGLKLNPMLAAAAMSMSSVFVVTNALRLRSFQPKRVEQKQDDILRENLKIEPKYIGDEKENKTMDVKKTMNIEGMTCEHCSARVEKALNALPGVTATVDLAEKKANVILTGEIGEETLRKAVEDAGYSVVSIEN